MIDRGAESPRSLLLAGTAAAVLAVALALAGVAMPAAALGGFVAGAAIYFALLFKDAHKP